MAVNCGVVDSAAALRCDGYSLESWLAGYGYTLESWLAEYQDKGGHFGGKGLVCERTEACTVWWGSVHWGQIF